MTAPASAPGSRIELVDALRGSALAGILLLHSIEHWDFSRYPENPPAWLRTLNTYAHDTGFFLFGGKSYGVFALLFGVSFCLILDGWARRGLGSTGRFAWRLAILAGFGYLHGLFFCGDFLMVIALLGLPLVFLHRLGNRALTWVAVVLLLQLPSVWQTARVLFDSGYHPQNPQHWAIYGQLWGVYSNGSFGDVLRTNGGIGQLTRLLWTFETGRYTQMLGLFVVGLLLGRSQVLVDPARALRLAKRALLWGAIGFILLYPLRWFAHHNALQGMARYEVGNLVSAYFNLAQIALWVGGFIFLWQSLRTRHVLALLAPYGRMTLTGYVTQSLIGVPLFYGFGFALYRYLGPFFSVWVGAALLGLQCTFAHMWFRHFHYGPLEWLWRSLTALSFTTPLRRREAPVALPAAVPS